MSEFLSQKQCLNEKQVAVLLNCSVSALRKWRQTGAGPRTTKMGHLVRYRRDDVERFLRDSSTGGAVRVFWLMDVRTMEFTYGTNKGGLDHHGSFADIMALCHVDDRDRCAEVVRKAIAAGESFMVTFRRLMSSEKYGKAQAAGSPIVDGLGATHWYVGMTEVNDVIALQGDEQ